jgi:transposase-like protein
VEGVSPRKAKEVTEELCGTTFSKSLISSLAGSLDSELSAWRNRRLEAEAYPYLFVDARYEKVRVDGRVVSQGVLVVSGVREDGFREILAVEVANTESEAPTRTSSGPRSDEGFREWSWWSQMTTKA